MNIKQVLLLSVLILSFQTSSAQMLHEKWPGPETLLAEELLKKVTGRIIQVGKNKNYIAISNVCSATLISESTIVSAGHCFKRNTSLQKYVDKEDIVFYLENSDFYFDIPGITSTQLAEDISELVGEDDHKVLPENQGRLNDVLSKLPKVKNIRFPKEYKKNLPIEIGNIKPKNDKEKKIILDLIENNKWNLVINASDLSVAQLDKKVPTSGVAIESLQNSDVIYVAGFYGGDLSDTMKIFKCTQGRTAYTELLAQAEFDSFINLLNFSDRLIVSTCDGEVLTGISGGPQIQFKNGKIALVGVSSATVYGSHTHVISPLINNLIWSLLFHHQK